jgi:RNA polymerase sigma factor (sigma-70 family)
MNRSNKNYKFTISVLGPIAVGGDRPDRDVSRPGGEAVAAHARELGSAEGRAEWLTAMAFGLRRAYRWRVPPRWSVGDWREELRAEGALAAWEAARDFDPGRGVPLKPFVERRVLFHLLHRYRKEWAYAHHLACESTDSEALGQAGANRPPEFEAVEVRELAAHLDSDDRRLVTILFWEGRSESEAAESLGVSQQAVSKRKLRILLRLRLKLGTPGEIARERVVRTRFRGSKNKSANASATGRGDTEPSQA